MSRLLFLHHLDTLMGQKCANPVCTHDHADERFLTPLCHPGVGVRVEALDACPDAPTGGAMALRCRQCQKPMVRIALAEPLTLVPQCRHGRALDVLYRDGALTVSCRRCGAVQGTADVAPYVPA